MNKLRSQIGRLLFKLLPAYNQSLYELSLRYVDRFNGDNNSNSETNGEYLFLRNVLPKIGGGVVFDVGANVGVWSKYCLSVEPHLSMHLFEPSKATFEKLSKQSWPASVKLNNYGLGEKNEFLDLNITGLMSGMNTLHKRRGVKGAEVTAVERIEITTLDEYCEKNSTEKIDCLKVDVEGHELAVFRGAQRMIERRAIDLIQFEYGGCNLDARMYLLDLWEILISNGYQIAKIYPNELRYLDRYEQSLETFKYSNYVASLKKLP